MSKAILELLGKDIVLGDGGYLIELERRGYVDSGSGREKVGTGRGSGQFTPEVAIENPDALAELHREFLNAGSQVLQALTFFATREKLTRAGYGQETEKINRAAVEIARAVADDHALVAGSVSRTQLFESEGPSAAGHVRELFEEQIALLLDANVDFLILETCSGMRAGQGRSGDGHDQFSAINHPQQRWPLSSGVRPDPGRRRGRHGGREL